jgi:hypothetical protein
LHAFEGDAPLGQVLMQLAQSQGPHIRNTELRHLAAGDQIGKTLKQGPLLPWGVAGGAPVQLHPIELAAKPLL